MDMGLCLRCDTESKTRLAHMSPKYCISEYCSEGVTRLKFRVSTVNVLYVRVFVAF